MSSIRRQTIALLAGLPLLFGAAGCNKKQGDMVGTAKPGEPGTPDFGEMVKLLKTNDEKAKRLACVGLGRLGAAAKDAIPELEKVRDSAKDADLKRIAGETIQKIQSAN